MTPRLSRLIAGIAAGSLTAVLIDQFVLPGTLMPGLIGAFTAATVLSLANSKA